MASPPSSQIPGLALPKKRPATTAISTTGLNPKRRKPSSAGPSNLRQTSFPPEGDPLSAAPLSALSPPTSAFGGAASRFSREASLESSSVLRGSGGRAAGTPSVVSGRSGRTGRKGVGAESKRKGRGKSEGTSSVGRPKSAAGAEEAEAEAPDDDDGDDDDEGGLDMEFDVNMIAAQAGDSQKDERDNVAYASGALFAPAC
jgi:transcription initiation factor TFIID subunit 11